MLYATIGRNIRACRIRRKITQERLAEQADISLSFLGHIERGTRKLSVETLCKIAVALNCSTDELLGVFPPNEDLRASARALIREILNQLDECDAHDKTASP